MMSNSLRKLLLTTGLLLPIFPLTSQSALANHLDFKVHNRTGVPLTQLYVSSSSRGIWEEDVLGRGILPSGQSAKINFTGNHNGCLFDILAVFSDGDEVVDPSVNLCRVSDVTFR